MDFTDILKQGKKRSCVKGARGEYGNCDYCEERMRLFEYLDVKKELWYL